MQTLDSEEVITGRGRQGRGSEGRRGAGANVAIGNRRSNLQVIADILRINGTKTAVMYQANLSYAQTQKYLEMLVHHKLLERALDANGRLKYRPTARGQQLLSLIESVDTFVADIVMPAPELGKDVTAPGAVRSRN